MPDEKEPKKVNTGALAREILILSRNTLLVNLRFMDMALSSLELKEVPGLPMCTDGITLSYDPRYILKRFSQDSSAPSRDYLHVVLHCIFRHMAVSEKINQDLWDIACDITVENAMTKLDLPAVHAMREQDQELILAELTRELPSITAERVYKYLKELNPSKADIARMKAYFSADDHAVWYPNDLPQDKSQDQAQENWKKISDMVQRDLETFSKKKGTKAGAIVQNLEEVNREKYDYATFLKKFSTFGEVMKINDEEFDNIFYTYGLTLYENMPLIEPLEYKDVQRIREFVIAIDTSGSVSGELVQAFIKKTYNILKSSESFFSKINLHILQCDADIQEDVRITSQTEFDAYLKNMKLKGFGGTDFRPVFTHIEKLRNQGDLKDLKGLIYFTDGNGTFPAKMPPYRTAFVYVKDDYNNPDVPSWAIRLVLSKEEIEEA